MLPVPAPLLRGGMVFLRPLAQRDAAALHAVFADPDRMRHWETPPHGNPATTGVVIRGWLAEAEQGTRLSWCLAEQARGPAFGLVTLYGISARDRRGELAFLQAGTHDGRGLMREALARLLAFGFTDLRLRRIGASCPAGAERAINTLKKLNFLEEGRLRGYLAAAEGATDLCLFGRLLSD